MPRAHSLDHFGSMKKCSLSISLRDGAATAAGCARHRRPSGDPFEGGPVGAVKRQRQQHAGQLQPHGPHELPLASGRLRCCASARGVPGSSHGAWPQPLAQRCSYAKLSGPVCAAAGLRGRCRLSTQAPQPAHHTAQARQPEAASRPAQPRWGFRSSSAGCAASTPRLSPRSLTCAYRLALHAAECSLPSSI